MKTTYKGITVLLITLLSITSCNDEPYNYEPDIIKHPSDTIVYLNDEVRLSVEAIDREGDALSYQWYIIEDTISRSSKVIVNETKDYFLPPTNEADTAFYFVTVISDNSNIIPSSKIATVIVLDTLSLNNLK